MPQSRQPRPRPNRTAYPDRAFYPDRPETWPRMVLDRVWRNLRERIMESMLSMEEERIVPSDLVVGRVVQRMISEASSSENEYHGGGPQASLWGMQIVLDPSLEHRSDNGLDIDNRIRIYSSIPGRYRPLRYRSRIDQDDVQFILESHTRREELRFSLESILQATRPNLNAVMPGLINHQRQQSAAMAVQQHSIEDINVTFTVTEPEPKKKEPLSRARLAWLT